MNSCRRGLAGRTWSVTRLLWRDRYTLSCLEDNKYTQCCATESQPAAEPVISSVSVSISIRLNPLSHWSLVPILLRKRLDVDINHPVTFLPPAFPLQNKDLKSRVSYLEGSQKSNKEALVGQLEQRIQELEERLEAEER